VKRASSQWLESAEMDLALLGQMVENISFNNARNYFPMECD
jgi:hypothetical protein